MRLAIVLSLGLLLSGCVPTADFVELRDEVRKVQAESRKFKETEAELRKMLEEADRLQKSGEVAQKLDALEAKIESLKIRQQGFDQKLGELLRRVDESARQEEGKGKEKEPALPLAKAPAPKCWGDLIKPEYKNLVAYDDPTVQGTAFDAIFTARYIDGFKEFILNPFTDELRQHWVSQTWTFDVQASYDFTGLIPVEEKPVPGYSKDAKEVARGKDGSIRETATAQTANYRFSDWRHVLLDGTSLTVGCNNITDRDPPSANGEVGNGQGYPGFTYDATNRFWYARLTKKF